MTTEEMNLQAWEVYERYMNLRVGKNIVTAPYFTNEVGRIFGKMFKDGGLAGGEIKRMFQPYNDRQTGYGWYRGKGSPEELEAAVAGMAGKEGIDIETFSRDGVRNYMMLNGLGVDCSGFVYNVLARVLGNDLDPGLAWKTEEHGAYKAGAFVFGEPASETIGAGEIKPLDLLLFRKPDGGRYYHVALILYRDGWRVVQSTSTAQPAGVGESELRIENGGLKFGFVPEYGKDWNQLYGEGRIEVRRLKILM